MEAQLPNTSGPAPAELVGFEVRLGAHSDVGQVRGNNEDRMLVFEVADRLVVPMDTTVVADGEKASFLMMVADGMGGMSGGETASQMCVDSLPELFLKHMAVAHGTPGERRRAALMAAIHETNARIFARAASDASLRGMGCTLTSALLSGNILLVGQVGDSRCYLGRNGSVQQLTRDQTVWESLRAQGRDPESALGMSQFKSMLIQAVGAQQEVQPVLTEQQLHAGDWLVLCSDGLYRVVEAEQINEILKTASEPAEKARELTTLANLNGGPDNVSVVVCQVVARSSVSAGKGVTAAA